MSLALVLDVALALVPVRNPPIPVLVDSLIDDDGGG